MENELMHHIQCKKGDVGRYVLLAGDPGRCGKIAEYLENPEFIVSNREYTTYTGYLEGEKVTVTSTGIGGPSAAIALEELKMIGADTFIRIGTSGGMQLDINPGDLVIATGAVRKEGTGREYLPIEFPAVSDFELTSALALAAKNLDFSHHIGVVECKDSYYGEWEPERMPVGYELINKWDAWVKGGALTSEMESATLFIVGSVLRARVGSVLLVASNPERIKQGIPTEKYRDTTNAIKTAVEAMRLIIKSDKNK